VLCSISIPQINYNKSGEHRTPFFHYYLCRSGSGGMEILYMRLKGVNIEDENEVLNFIKNHQLAV